MKTRPLSLILQNEKMYRFILDSALRLDTINKLWNLTYSSYW